MLRGVTTFLGAAALFLLIVSMPEIVTAAKGEAAVEQDGVASAARLQFAAASLRPFHYDVIGTPLRCRGVDGELFPQPGASPLGPVPQGRCTGTYVGVRDLIAMAYASPSRNFRMVGLSSTFDEDKMMYQFQAVAPDPSRVTKEELQEMLQSLLRDRFNLRSRREMRQMDGFLMLVAKGGIKFKETLLDEEPASLRPQDPDAPRRAGDGIHLVISSVIAKGRYSMNQLAGFVSSLIVNDKGQFTPVLDQTNLSGIYDITFRIDMISRPSGSGGRGEDGTRSRPLPATSIPTALEQQLGLHLEPAKVATEFLFIDHIEKPTEN